MRRLVSLVVLCIAVCQPSLAAAVQPAPLQLDPVLMRISFHGPGLQVCPASGVSSSAVSATMQASGHVDATASLSGGEITVGLSGTATAGTFQLDLSARVNAQIPQLGAPSSPVYIAVEAISGSGSARLTQVPVGFNSFPATCTDTPPQSLPESTLLGLGAGPDNFVAAQYMSTDPNAPQRWLVPLAYPAGDYVLFSLYVPIVLQLTGPAGPFTAAFKISFRTTTPAIGNGDMNGDRSVSVVDSTLLRRLLAGLPIH